MRWCCVHHCAAGLSVCRFVGLSDCRFVPSAGTRLSHSRVEREGPFDSRPHVTDALVLCALSRCRFVGLSVCRIVGLSICRLVGLSVCRFAYAGIGLPSHAVCVRGLLFPRTCYEGAGDASTLAPVPVKRARVASVRCDGVFQLGVVYVCDGVSPSTGGGARRALLRGRAW